VHGTAGRPEDHWALGYQKILPDLAYLFADGKNVNVERVRRGWSRFDTRWGEGRFAPAFRAAEREAERAERL
jgi:endonuclease YncB( thermonuclease family)